jgi:hypothetical protein
VSSVTGLCAGFLFAAKLKRLVVIPERWNKMDRNSVPAAHTAVILIIIVVSFFQISAVFSKPITATVDGTTLRTDVPPTVIQERTMVPFRSIFEVLGASITVEPPEIPADTVHESQLEDEIVQAYRFAYSLEEQLWDQPEIFGTKEAVFQFMQQGFSDVFAWNLADYYWTEPDGLMGVGAFLIIPEHTIHVLEIDMENNEASLWHETDEWERDHWGMDAYKIVTLQLEDGILKVKDQRSIGTPPA